MPIRTVDDVIKLCQVPPSGKFRLADHDPGWAGDESVEKEQRKRIAERLLTEDVSELAAVQDLLYADKRYAVLIVLQAMDAAGKDGIIKHVMSGLNPQGCQVHSFQQPSRAELAHTFLWRCMKALPERGKIGIFNRSYYEEVLVVKVHPDLLEKQKLTGNPAKKDFWRDRYEDIRQFERHVTRNGTIVFKFFLNVSKGQQRKRFLERLNDPKKHWKFSAADLAERGFWDQYMEAYQEALAATSTDFAPWYVIPADHKWVSRSAVAMIVTETLKRLDLGYPKISAEQKQEIERAKTVLENEK